MLQNGQDAASQRATLETEAPTGENGQGERQSEAEQVDDWQWARSAREADDRRREVGRERVKSDWARWREVETLKRETSTPPPPIIATWLSCDGTAESHYF